MSYPFRWVLEIAVHDADPWRAGASKSSDYSSPQPPDTFRSDSMKKAYL